MFGITEYVFWNIINIFTVTFNQFNASLMNKMFFSLPKIEKYN